jgi:hypothetical protein
MPGIYSTLSTRLHDEVPGGSDQWNKHGGDCMQPAGETGLVSITVLSGKPM